MKGNITELWKYKIHRIYSVRTDISPYGDMCALRGVLQTARHQVSAGVWGKRFPIVAKNATTPFFGCFPIISIHQSVWELLYQWWRCDKA